MSKETIKNCPARVLFTDGYFCRQTDGNILCSDCTDCPYKHLQQLKRENKDLKRNLKDTGRIIEIVTKENEQLKIECDMYKTYYRAKHNDIDGKIFKYKEALEEIRQRIKEVLE